MLSTLHNRAYQDFMTLLTDFADLIVDLQDREDLTTVKSEFEKLKQWFGQNIDRLNEDGIDEAYVPRWQSIQREIVREFKLLNTDMLFLASSRQNATKNKRLKSISDRLKKLKQYCQGLLKEASDRE